MKYSHRRGERSHSDQQHRWQGTQPLLTVSADFTLSSQQEPEVRTLPDLSHRRQGMCDHTWGQLLGDLGGREGLAKRRAGDSVSAGNQGADGDSVSVGNQGADTGRKNPQIPGGSARAHHGLPSLPCHLRLLSAWRLLLVQTPRPTFPRHGPQQSRTLLSSKSSAFLPIPPVMASNQDLSPVCSSTGRVFSPFASRVSTHTFRLQSKGCCSFLPVSTTEKQATGCT